VLQYSESPHVFLAPLHSECSEPLQTDVAMSLIDDIEKTFNTQHVGTCISVTTPNLTRLVKRCRAQWPHGLRHEMSSPAQTLGSSVRIPLEARMYVCIYSVSVLSCVQVAALRRVDLPSTESYRLCTKIKKLKKRPRSNKGL
jgi:hypothetical protein